MTTELLKQALDALEESVDLVQSDYNTDWRHGMPTRKVQLDASRAALIAHRDVIDAIRAHLAQPPATSGDYALGYAEGFNDACKPKQAEPVANNDEVICPNCCTQFRAIPQNVQRLMLDAGFEPPFTHPAAPVPDVLPGKYSAWTIAQNLHRIYESLAPSFGYETRPETRGWVADLPNGKLMRAAVEQLMHEGWIAAAPPPVALTPLTESEIELMWGKAASGEGRSGIGMYSTRLCVLDFAREVLAAHGIKQGGQSNG